MKIAPFIAVALALMPVAGHAKDTFNHSGNDLKTECEDSNPVSSGFCLGYILATMNGMEYALTLAETRVCVPATVTVGQMKDVVLAYMRRYPETRDRNMIIIMTAASAEAWPCRN